MATESGCRLFMRKQKTPLARRLFRLDVDLFAANYLIRCVNSAGYGTRGRTCRGTCDHVNNNVLCFFKDALR
jgi:hypothetical protein